MRTKKLKMYIHAESIQGNNPLPGEGNFDEYDRRLVAFLRLGTDYQDNYYQIEVPLKPTKFGENSSNRISAEDVWNPDSNSIDFPVELLSKIKSKYLSKNSLTDASFYDEEMNEVDEFTTISNLSGSKQWSPNNFEVLILSDSNHGDLNFNQIINISDVVILIEHLMAYNIFENEHQALLADLNKDDLINISDVVSIITQILEQ